MTTNMDDGFNLVQQKVEGQFPWRAYGRDILMLLFDFALLMLVVYAASFIATYSIFHFWKNVCPALTGDNVVQIVKHIAWPSAAILFVFVYRNALNRILYATMCFIFKSHYRHGTEMVSPDETSPSQIKNAECLERLSAEVEKTKEDDAKVETAKTLAFSLLNLAAREVALNKMQSDFAHPVLRRYSIIGLRCAFDGIIVFPEGDLFGIKVLRTKSAEDWKDALSKVAIAYLKWSSKHKYRFTFVACAVGKLPAEERDKLALMANALPCRTHIRFCDYSGNALKEVQ